MPEAVTLAVTVHVPLLTNVTAPPAATVQILEFDVANDTVPAVEPPVIVVVRVGLVTTSKAYGEPL